MMVSRRIEWRFFGIYVISMCKSITVLVRLSVASIKQKSALRKSKLIKSIMAAPDFQIGPVGEIQFS